MFTSTFCSRTGWSRNHDLINIVLIPKLLILLYPFLWQLKQHFFHKNCRLHLFYSYCASSWNKWRACLSVVFSIFSPRLGELWHNTGKNKFTEFRKANELVKFNFILISPQKRSNKVHFTGSHKLKLSFSVATGQWRTLLLTPKLVN